VKNENLKPWVWRSLENVLVTLFVFIYFLSWRSFWLYWDFRKVNLKEKQLECTKRSGNTVCLFLQPSDVAQRVLGVKDWKPMLEDLDNVSKAPRSENQCWRTWTTCPRRQGVKTNAGGQVQRVNQVKTSKMSLAKQNQSWRTCKTCQPSENVENELGQAKPILEDL
jgi:hypothetical protein